MSADMTVRRYVEAISRKDPARLAALLDENVVLHDPFFPEPVKGRAAVEALVQGVLKAFPDLNWKQVGDVITSGDRVAWVVAVSGTNDGPFAMPDGEMPPTGRKMSYEAAVLWTLNSDGLIIEERSYWDSTGVAAQLGMTG